MVYLIIILALVGLFLGAVAFIQKKSEKSGDSVSTATNGDQQEINGYGEQTWYPGKLGKIEAGAKPSSGPPDSV